MVAWRGQCRHLQDPQPPLVQALAPFSSLACPLDLGDPRKPLGVRPMKRGVWYAQWPWTGIAWGSHSEAKQL